MALFPFCVDLRGKKGLIVGGGALALRKIETLTPFKPSLRVVGPEILPEILELAEMGEIELLSGDTALTEIRIPFIRKESNKTLENDKRA